MLEYSNAVQLRKHYEQLSNEIQLKVGTLKGMLITKINCDKNCTDIYKIKKGKDVFRNIHAAEKYKITP